MDLFNQGLQREFYTNDDYLRVGGQKDEDDDNESDTRTSGYGDEKDKPQKIFSMKRKEGVTTSRIGNLLT